MIGQFVTAKKLELRMDCICGQAFTMAGFRGDIAVWECLCGRQFVPEPPITIGHLETNALRNKRMEQGHG